MAGSASMANPIPNPARLINAAQLTWVPPPWLRGGSEGGGASSAGPGMIDDVSVVGGPVVVAAGASVVVVEATAPDSRVVVGAGVLVVVGAGVGLAAVLVVDWGAVVVVTGALVGGEVAGVVVVVGSMGRIWAPTPGAPPAAADARAAATRTPRRTEGEGIARGPKVA